MRDYALHEGRLKITVDIIVGGGSACVVRTVEHHTIPMTDENKPDDIQIKLYEMLVDQSHKYNTVFWQFPLALLVTNFLALDKCLAHPKILFGVSILDCVLVYAFHRFVINQRAIIKALKDAEKTIASTKYEPFIPKFEEVKYKAPCLTVFDRGCTVDIRGWYGCFFRDQTNVARTA